jgi:TolB protein
MDADGSDRVLHVPSSETLNLAGGPASSDGQQIAFYGWDDTDPDSNGLYIGSPDLSQLRHVLALPDGVTAIDTLAFAPDGSGVLFWGQRGSDGVVTHAGDLFMVDADGTHLRQLNSDDFVVGEVRGLPATLSPDAGRVAFAAFESGSGGGRSAVFVVPASGGAAEPITDFSAGIWVAAWAPVGDRIASWTWSNQTAISVVNADTMTTRQLAGGADEVGYGAWSPAGDYLVVGRGPDGHRDLWIMDLEGQFVAQVTHEPSYYGMYSWQP